MSYKLIIACSEGYTILRIDSNSDSILGYDCKFLICKNLSFLGGKLSNWKMLDKALKHSNLLNTKIILYDKFRCSHVCQFSILGFKSNSDHEIYCLLSLDFSSGGIGKIIMENWFDKPFSSRDPEVNAIDNVKDVHSGIFNLNQQYVDVLRIDSFQTRIASVNNYCPQTSEHLEQQSSSQKHPQLISTVLPRRRRIDHFSLIPPAPVTITAEVLWAMQNRPLPIAAASLGLSATALKRACRRLGIARWGYNREHSHAAAASKLTKRRTTETTEISSSAPPHGILSKQQTNFSFPPEPIHSRTIFRHEGRKNKESWGTRLGQDANTTDSKAVEIQDIHAGHLRRFHPFQQMDDGTSDEVAKEEMDVEHIFREELQADDDDCAMLLLAAVWEETQTANVESTASRG